MNTFARTSNDLILFFFFFLNNSIFVHHKTKQIKVSTLKLWSLSSYRYIHWFLSLIILLENALQVYGFFAHIMHTWTPSYNPTLPSIYQIVIGLNIFLYVDDLYRLTSMFVQCTKSASGLCCRLCFFRTVWSSVQKLSGLSASRQGENALSLLLSSQINQTVWTVLQMIVNLLKQHLRFIKVQT